MARKLRVEYPGAVYHVMNRGDRREPIFQDDADRQRFWETLGEVCAKTGWQIHAFCLMGNHFHLVLETPQPNLVAGMKWFLGTYTSRFNRRHRAFLATSSADAINPSSWTAAATAICGRSVITFT
jgi:putative transposase